MNNPNLDTSESLLTEILLHVQVLNANVEEFKGKLDSISQNVKALETKVDNIVDQAFINKDLHAHKKWHEKHGKRKKFLGIF